MSIRPTTKDLERLKTPFGKLIKSPPEQTIPQLKRIIQDTKPPKVIAVGDVVSRETLKAGVRIDLRIVDNRSMRRDLSIASYPAKKEVGTRRAQESLNNKLNPERCSDSPKSGSNRQPRSNTNAGSHIVIPTHHKRPRETQNPFRRTNQGPSRTNNSTTQTNNSRHKTPNGSSGRRRRLERNPEGRN